MVQLCCPCGFLNTKYEIPYTQYAIRIFTAGIAEIGENSCRVAALPHQA